MSIQICCVASNIFGFTGGIQSYTHTLLKALQVVLPEAHYVALLKYDRDRDVIQAPDPIPQVDFRCFGHWPRFGQTVAMTIAILWIAFRRPDTGFITTHVNYARALYLAKLLFGIQYWIVAHGLEVWHVEPGLLQQGLKQADAIAAVSHYTRQRLLAEQNLPPWQIGILTNTVDAQRFSIRPKPTYLLQRHGLSRHQRLLLTVCRLGKSGTYKGYEQIIRALPAIQQQIPDIHYVLVGKGDDTPRIRQLIAELGLQRQVTLTGFVPDAELPDYYNLCDLFAMPSTGEGFGIVYLEALACGKPVLAGDCDGAMDPLLNGELGCLVDPHNLSELTTTLIQILSGHYPNPNLYRPEFLREQAIAHFSNAQFQAQLLHLLDQHALVRHGRRRTISHRSARRSPLNSATRSPF